MRTISKLFIACAVAVGLQVALTVGARAEEKWAGAGTTVVRGASVKKLTSLGAISPSVTFSHAAYGTGGVGLRNRGGGAIAVSGVELPAKAAYLYWAVITNGAVPSANYKVGIQRVLPTTSSSVVVTGSVVGTGASPCWGGTGITVFRASVPLSVANGNGEYLIVLSKGASAITNGSSPWEDLAYPSMEGASLVIVGSGSNTVTIYDKGFAGNTFDAFSGLSYTLTLPVASTGGFAQYDSIGADGQHGLKRTDQFVVSDETTIVNGVAVAGPGSQANDSDWNGSAAFPIPQLWDDTGHVITPQAPSGTKALNFTIGGGSSDNADCLTPVANVISIR